MKNREEEIKEMKERAIRSAKRRNLSRSLVRRSKSLFILSLIYLSIRLYPPVLAVFIFIFIFAPEVYVYLVASIFMD